ncbi:MAG: hypothetical protein AAFZ38_12155, partial [Myxococcota bacterium]
WEEGRRTPTYRQLKDASKTYKRPLVTFFLSRPPEVADRLPDLRAFPAGSAGSSIELAALVRQVQARQDELRTLLLPEEGEDFDPLDFVGSVRLLDTTPEAAAASIRVAWRAFVHSRA